MSGRVKMSEISALDRFRSLLAIDRDDLDSAVADQPELFSKVADTYTLAVAERDALELDLERKQAQISINFRREAVDNNEKTTEGSLKEKVMLHGEVKRLADAVQDAKEQAAYWGTLVESFKQRRDALKMLVPLYLSRLGGSSMGATRDDMAMSNYNRMVEQKELRRRGGDALERRR